MCFNTFIQHIKCDKYRQFGFSFKLLNPIHWFQFADDAAVIVAKNLRINIFLIVFPSGANGPTWYSGWQMVLTKFQYQLANFNIGHFQYLGRTSVLLCLMSELTYLLELNRYDSKPKLNLEWPNFLAMQKRQWKNSKSTLLEIPNPDQSVLHLSTITN